MCDDNDLMKWQREGLTRRQMGVLGAGAVLASCAPSGVGVENAAAADAPQPVSHVTGTQIAIATKDGTMDAFFVAPSGLKSPLVILWPDIAGLREVKRAMASRLAANGYAVVVPNQYYRDAPAEHWRDFADFLAQNAWNKARSMRSHIDADGVMRDTRAIVAWAETRAEVDTSKPYGAQGYCMGGPFAFWSAAALPMRAGAVASFHGGGLADEAAAQSPHKMLSPRAAYLVAIGQNDDAKAPQEKDILRTALARNTAEIEVYAADHGWCVPDGPAYNATEAERAWDRLISLYKTALK